jgi:serine protease Do
MVRLLIAISLFVFYPITAVLAVTQPAVSSSVLPHHLAPMLKHVLPAIVSISVQGETPNMFADGNQPSSPGQSAPHGKGHKFHGFGSGVILNAKSGYIITNAHIVRDAKTILVTLHDGRRLRAKLIGSDYGTDIAIIKIKAQHLQAISLGDSTQLEVGDFVVAIGNPFGLDHSGTDASVTFGIVSALKRSEFHLGSLESYIQTDAAINPGNSGGALVNMRGELVGINSAIISPLPGNVGVGLAIPVNMARSISNQIIKYGSVHRGLMGIFMQPITPELAEAFHLADTHGAIVSQVNPGSPAAHAGLKAGDIITKLNNKEIHDATQVRNQITMVRVGDDVKITVLRDGKRRNLIAKVEDVKRHQDRRQSRDPYLYGLALRDISELSPIHGAVGGVLVSGVVENSPGYRSGLRPGDIIIDAERQPTASVAALQKVVQGVQKQLLLHVLRGPGSMYLLIR